MIKNNFILICKDLAKKEKLEQEKNDENIFFEKQSCQTGKIKVKWLFEDTFAEYEGDVNLITRFPEGNGKLINKDGTYYIGEFKCGKYDGKGTLFDKNDQIIYEGYFVEGLYEGKGKMNLDKYYYIGEFKEGKFDGKGKLFKNNNLFYEGDFIDGKFNGKGTLFNGNSIIYEGNFINNNFEGEGIYYQQDGYFLIGNFKDDEPEGEGILFDKNNNIIYHGNFDKYTMYKLIPKMEYNNIKLTFKLLKDYLCQKLK